MADEVRLTRPQRNTIESQSERDCDTPSNHLRCGAQFVMNVKYCYFHSIPSAYGILRLRAMGLPIESQQS